MTTNQHQTEPEVIHPLVGRAVQIVCGDWTDENGKRYGQRVEHNVTIIDIDPDFGDFIVRRPGEPFNVRIHRERVVAVLNA